jgi:preprotein translocase subunit SecE
MAMMNPFQFIQQVRTEGAKIVWPTRREVFLTTIMVFALSAITALFFSVVDISIRAGLQALLSAVGG